MSLLNMISILFSVALVSGAILFILNNYFGNTASAAKKRIGDIKKISREEIKTPSSLILKKEKSEGFFSRIVDHYNFALFNKFQIVLFQSGVRISIDKVIFYSLSLSFFLFLISYINLESFFLSFLLGLLALLFPFGFLLYKAKKRKEEFKSQFPDAVDFLSRSLRAGQSISASFGMIATEYPDPLGAEFRQVFDELNYGLGFNQAMENMALRNQDEDLDFFIASLIIQRESGGNLIELLTNLTKLIRERIKVYGKIQSLTAEGRLSANLLSALPFFLIGILLILNPTYISMLWEPGPGRHLSYVAIVLVLVGVVWIKKIVNIKI